MPPRIEPPSWWNIGLYAFVRDLPPEGWVWEFMRRAVLLRLLHGAPVDAMNPEPNLGAIDEDWADLLYTSWPQALARYPIYKNKPFYLTPAVRPAKKGWPQGFRGQPLQLPPSMIRGGKWVNIAVDITRLDRVIHRDLDTFLAQARTNTATSPPENIAPKIGQWAGARFLEIWDLKQFGVASPEIARLLNIVAPNTTQVSSTYAPKKVDNTYPEVREYIDLGKWEMLARYVETE